MPQPVRTGIGLDVRRDLVHEALVRERVLQPRGERSGPVKNGEWTVVRKHALAADDTRAALRVAHAARHVRRRGVAAVVERRRGSGAGDRGVNGGGFKPGATR